MAGRASPCPCPCRSRPCCPCRRVRSRWWSWSAPGSRPSSPCPSPCPSCLGLLGLGLGLLGLRRSLLGSGLLRGGLLGGGLLGLRLRGCGLGCLLLGLRLRGLGLRGLGLCSLRLRGLQLRGLGLLSLGCLRSGAGAQDVAVRLVRRHGGSADRDRVLALVAQGHLDLAAVLVLRDADGRPREADAAEHPERNEGRGGDDRCEDRATRLRADRCRHMALSHGRISHFAYRPLDAASGAILRRAPRTRDGELRRHVDSARAPAPRPRRRRLRRARRRARTRAPSPPGRGRAPRAEAGGPPPGRPTASRASPASRSASVDHGA